MEYSLSINALQPLNKHWRGLVRSVLMLLLVLLCLVPSFAKDREKTPPEINDPFDSSVFLKLMTNTPDDMTSWRAKAEEELKRNPHSYSGNALMGLIMHRSEADLPRASYHYKQAMSIALQSARKGDTEAQQFYLYILLEMDTLYGELDQHENRLKILETLEKLIHNPLINAQRAWPLMKLGKEKLARMELDKAFRSSVLDIRVVAWNSLGALEGELGHYSASHFAFESLINEIKANNSDLLNTDCTFYRNCGEMCLPLGDYSGAEQNFTKATQVPFNPQTFSNPYQDLCNLYLSQGRFREAVESGKKMVQWTRALKPFLYQQCLAEDAMITGTLYLELGLTDDAIRRLSYAASRPDRQGGTSIGKDRMEAGVLVTWRSALLSQVEHYKEQMAYSRGIRWWQLYFKSLALRWDADVAGEKAAALIVTNKRLPSSLCAYGAGSLVLNEWTRPELVSVLGPGVCAASLKELEKNPPENIKFLSPFLEVLKGEISSQIGSKKETVSHLQNAIKNLPEAEVLLKGRTNAMLAATLEKQGRRSEALAIIEDLLATCPTAFRSTNTYIPVTIIADKNYTNKMVAKMIGKSPRFKIVSDGLPLNLQLSGQRASATLFSRDEKIILHMAAELQNDPFETAASLVELFQNYLFSAKINLTQVDMNSLDGANLSTSLGAQESIKELFSEDRGEAL